MLRDAHEAEDLAQDAWLSWFRRPPPPGTAPRRWITGVVRNLAADRHRKHGRRSRAEAAASEPAAPPPPQAQVAREAMREELARVVAALREPYRESVRLHFYEDLDPRQIAQLLDVPLETVRTRLKRALAELSTELDRRSRGDRQRWLECLVLLLPSPSPRTGLRRPRAAHPAQLATASAVVACIGTLLWWSPDRTAELQAQVVAGPAPELAQDLRAPTGGARASLAALPSEERTRTEPLDAALALTGRVLDASGVPVGGARVGAWFDVAPERAGSTLTAPQRETRSDAAGFFTLADLPRCFFAYAETADQVGQEILMVDLEREAAAPGLLEDIELRVAPPRTLSGRVVDEDGHAVACAEIVLQGGRAGPTSKRSGSASGLVYVEQIGSRAVTGADGGFRMEGLTNSLSLLHVRKEGLVTLDRLVNGGEQELELRLERGHLLTVRVRDEHGTALVGASVKAMAGRTESDPGLTDADGRVALGPFAVVSEFALRITAPGREPVLRGWLTLYPKQAELVIDLPPTRSVSVLVRDASGAPVPHAALAVFARLREPSGVPEGVRRAGARAHARSLEGFADEQGRWTATGLPAEALAIEVLERESRAPLARVELDPHAEQVVLELGRSASLVSGVLRDARTGLALGSEHAASVWAFERGGAWRTLLAQADERGRYALADVTGGEWIGCALAQGYAPGFLVPVAGSARVVDVALVPARDARLCFTDRNGLPLSGGCVRIEDEHGEPVPARTQEHRWTSEVRIERDGRVRLAGLPDQPVTVVCYPSGAHTAFERRLEPHEMSAATLVVAHPDLDLGAARARVELEVLMRTQAGLADYRGVGQLRVSESGGRATHALAFDARVDGCLLECDQRVREIRLDPRDVPIRVLDGLKRDDDWSPRARLPGFEGRRALFPLALTPGRYEVVCTRAGEPEVRLAFEVPASDRTVRVPIVLDAR
jgi:RNA polymerase sigma-70 factor (ECF subfamily)